MNVEWKKDTFGDYTYSITLGIAVYEFKADLMHGVWHGKLWRDDEAVNLKHWASYGTPEAAKAAALDLLAYTHPKREIDGDPLAAPCTFCKASAGRTCEDHCELSDAGKNPRVRDLLHAEEMTLDLLGCLFAEPGDEGGEEWGMPDLIEDVQRRLAEHLHLSCEVPRRSACSPEHLRGAANCFREVARALEDSAREQERRG